MPSFSKVVRNPVSQAPDLVLTTGIQVAARQREVHLHVGEQAPSSGLISFTHTQNSPAATWTIANPWGVRAASVQVMVADQVVLTDIAENSPSHIVILFSQPQSGLAQLIKGAS